MNDLVKPLPADGSPHGKPRLLVVEDGAYLRQLLGEILHPDYEVVLTVDGEQAWQRAQAEPFDLVLSDVEMPNLDGIELTRRLRALARTASVPIFLLSANNKLATLLRGFEAGADDFVLKPFRLEELLTRVRCRHRLCEMRRRMLLQPLAGAVH